MFAMRAKVKPPPTWGVDQRVALDWPDVIPREMVSAYCKDPRKYGFAWDAVTLCWKRTRRGSVDILHAPEPLPFFLDPNQIRELTPEIDWDRRVGDRVRHFLTMHLQGAGESSQWRRQYLTGD